MKKSQILWIVFLLLCLVASGQLPSLIRSVDKGTDGFCGVHGRYLDEQELGDFVINRHLEDIRNRVTSANINYYSGVKDFRRAYPNCCHMMLVDYESLMVSKATRSRNLKEFGAGYFLVKINNGIPGSPEFGAYLVDACGTRARNVNANEEWRLYKPRPRK